MQMISEEILEDVSVSDYYGHIVDETTDVSTKNQIIVIGRSGGGLTQKCRTCMGVGGVFGTQNTKVTCTLLYNKGGCPYFIPNHKSINGTFVHTFHNKIMKNYEKMPNFHSFYTNFYIFFNELLL